ncbi:unnamed protein product [Ectocarpus sp. 12 AP-2014]
MTGKQEQGAREGMGASGECPSLPLKPFSPFARNLSSRESRFSSVINTAPQQNVQPYYRCRCLQGDFYDDRTSFRWLGRGREDGGGDGGGGGRGDAHAVRDQTAGPFDLISCSQKICSYRTETWVSPKPDSSKRSIRPPRTLSNEGADSVQRRIKHNSLAQE